MITANKSINPHWRPGVASLKLRARCLGFVVLALVFATSRGTAETANQHEYELKAGVLYHIIEYVEWPREALSNRAAVVQIGLLGEIPFPAALEVLNSKVVQGRKLVVKRISSPQEATDCQVLFIGASEKSRLPQIVADVKNLPILTVSEVDGFAERGGMVNLVAGPNRIIMEINREAAGQARLNFSSQLLRLAKVFPK